MESIRDELIGDINKIIKSIDLLDKLEDFKTLKKEEEETSDFVASVGDIQSIIKANSEGIAKLKGAQILYLAGRLEVFVKNILEECAVKLAESKSKYSDLPDRMKAKLFENTLEVVGASNKYNFSEPDCKEFLKIMNANINEDDISTINSECLTITSSNVKAKVLQELFSRIGIEDIWTQIGKQNAIKIFFKTDKDGVSKDRSMKLLNEIMNKRNSIAHPSEEVNWPSSEDIVRYCRFIQSISNQIFEISSLHLSVSVS